MSILQISFLSAVLIVIIVLARALLIYKLPKRTFCFLWMIVLIRLLVPFSFTSVISVYSLIQRNEAAMDMVKQLPAARMFPAERGEGGFNLPQELPELSGETAGGDSVGLVIWAFGVCLSAAFFVSAYSRSYRKFRMSLPVQQELVQTWQSAHPLKRTIAIRQSDMIETPLSYGMFHPVILMPESTDWSDSSRLRYALEHEYVHIRRFDTLTKLLLAAALCIHWFNPFVWLMYFLFNRDMELSCDELVVRRFGEDTRSAYAMALIGMEERKSGFMPLCNHFSKHAIEERIRAVMKIRKVTFISVVFAGILIIAITLCFAASASSDDRQDMARSLGSSPVEEEEISARAQAAAAAVGYDEKAIAARMAELDLQIREWDGTEDTEDAQFMAEIEWIYLDSMRQDLERQDFFETYYGEYDICYQIPECRLYKGEKSIHHFYDEQNGGALWADNYGEICVEVVRDGNGDIARLIVEDSAAASNGKAKQLTKETAQTDSSGNTDAKDRTAQDEKLSYHAGRYRMAYQVSQKERFAEYEQFGISYDSASGFLMYKGKNVGYFKDEYKPGAYTRFTDEGGELGVVVVRDASGNILEIQSGLLSNQSGKEPGAPAVEDVSYHPAFSAKRQAIIVIC